MQKTVALMSQNTNGFATIDVNKYINPFFINAIAHSAI